MSGAVLQFRLKFFFLGSYLSRPTVMMIVINKSTGVGIHCRPLLQALPPKNCLPNEIGGKQGDKNWHRDMLVLRATTTLRLANTGLLLL